MRIIVASDSHGHSEILDKIHEAHPEAKLFLHCGDLCDEPMYYPDWIIVQGNNDYWRDLPPRRILRVGSHRLLMEHSHHCSYFNREEHLVDIAKENECDIVCFGHTHCSYFEKIDGVYLLNPGSTTFPRDGNPPSYAILDIEENCVKAEIVFLEKKTKEKKSFWTFK